MKELTKAQLKKATRATAASTVGDLYAVIAHLYGDETPTAWAEIDRAVHVKQETYGGDYRWWLTVCFNNYVFGEEPSAAPDDVA